MSEQYEDDFDAANEAEYDEDYEDDTESSAIHDERTREDVVAPVVNDERTREDAIALVVNDEICLSNKDERITHCINEDINTCVKVVIEEQRATTTPAPIARTKVDKENLVCDVEFSVDLVQLHCKRSCNHPVSMDDDMDKAARCAAKRVQMFRRLMAQQEQKQKEDKMKYVQVKHAWRQSYSKPKSSEEYLKESTRHAQQLKEQQELLKLQAKAQVWYKRKKSHNKNTHQDIERRATEFLAKEKKAKRDKATKEASLQNRLNVALKHISVIARAAREKSCGYKYASGSYILKQTNIKHAKQATSCKELQPDHLDVTSTKAEDDAIAPPMHLEPIQEPEPIQQAACNDTCCEESMHVVPPVQDPPIVEIHKDTRLNEKLALEDSILDKENVKIEDERPPHATSYTLSDI